MTMQQQEAAKEEGPFSKGNIRLINLLNQIDGGRIGSLTLQNSYNVLNILRREAERQNVKISEAFIFVSNPRVTEMLSSVEETYENAKAALTNFQEGVIEATLDFERDEREYAELVRQYESLEVREYSLETELYSLQGGAQPTKPTHKLSQIDWSAVPEAEKIERQPYRMMAYGKSGKSQFEIELTKLFSGLDHPDMEFAKANLKKILDALMANKQITGAAETSLSHYFVLCRNDEGQMFDPVKKFDDLEDATDTIIHKMDDLTEPYLEMGVKSIIYTEHNNRLRHHIDGTLKHIEFLEKRIKDEKKQRGSTATITSSRIGNTSSGPTISSQPTQQPQPQPQPQPARRPPPIVQPQSAPQTKPQQGPKRTVMPPPIQPQPSKRPTTTVQRATRNGGSWSWSLPKPVSAIALSCLLIIGGRYAVRKATNFDAFSSKAWSSIIFAGKASDPPENSDRTFQPQNPPPAPRAIVAPTLILGSSQAKSQQTRDEIFYVAYDPISLWSKPGEGRKQLGKLSFGEALQVELPLGQEELYQNDVWVHVRLADGRNGYVLGKQLSKTEPVRSVEIGETTPNQSLSSAAPERLPELSHVFEKAKPEKQMLVTAYICAGKSFTDPTSGPPSTLHASTPIKASADFYSANGGRDTKLELRTFFDDYGSPYAKVFLYEDGGKVVLVPYSAVSLERSSCTQAQVIRGYSSSNPK